MENIKECLIEILVNCTKNDEFKNIQLKDRLNIESIAFIELIVAIEDKFNITIPNEDVIDNKFITFENLIEYVKNKIA